VLYALIYSVIDIKFSIEFLSLALIPGDQWG
jgi:hypothetical protein